MLPFNPYRYAWNRPGQKELPPEIVMVPIQQAAEENMRAHLLDVEFDLQLNDWDREWLRGIKVKA